MQKLIFLFLIIPFLSFSQLSESQMAEMVDEVNKGCPLTDPRTGVVLSGAMSYGTTLVFMYDVPEDWFPPENMKELLIDNFKVAEIADVYYSLKVNVNFTYYKENRLIKMVKVKYKEFGDGTEEADENSYSQQPNRSIFELGKFVSFKNHPKAKGVNIKVKKPVEFELLEGDRPNIVGKFNHKKENLVYIIGINNSQNFTSRSYTREWFLDSSETKSYAKSSVLEFGGEYISHKLVDIDRYPAIEITFDYTKEVIDRDIIFRTVMWVIPYEDNIIYLSGGTEAKNFESYYPLFIKITNSIIFEDQYNTVANNYEGDEVDFEHFIDEFYREIESEGIFKSRPKKAIIELKSLDAFKDTNHLHGYSVGYDDDERIEIYINKRSWNTFSKAQKYYLIFHELCHDVLNLDDLSTGEKNDKAIMYPSIGAYKSLTMDDFIENFHMLIENYTDTSETDTDEEDQSQLLNGISLSGPDGFVKTGDLQWSSDNDLITVQSINEKISNEEFDVVCKEGSKSTTFVTSELIEISGKDYLICLQKGDDGLIFGQTIVYKEGHSYIVTTITNSEEDDSFSAKEKAFERVGYLLGYMITRVNYF